MQKTEHYQLNQWEPADRVLRTDFNEDNRKIDAALEAMPQIAVGNYIGSGAYGIASPCKLSFSFTPKLLIITEDADGQVYSGYFIYGSSTGMTNWYGGATSNFTVIVSWSKHTVSWYTNNGNSAHQLNSNGNIYHYLAIG